MSEIVDFLRARIAEDEAGATDDRGRAECAAKRVLVDDYAHLLTCAPGGERAHAEWVMRVLAQARYSAHPDYKRGWRV